FIPSYEPEVFCVFNEHHDGQILDHGIEEVLRMLILKLCLAPIRGFEYQRNGIGDRHGKLFFFHHPLPRWADMFMPNDTGQLAFQPNGGVQNGGDSKRDEVTVCKFRGSSISLGLIRSDNISRCEFRKISREGGYRKLDSARMTMGLLLVEIDAANGGLRLGKKPDAGAIDHEALCGHLRNDSEGFGALSSVDIRVGSQLEKPCLHTPEQGGLLSLLSLRPLLVRDIPKNQYGAVDYALV